MVTGKQVYDLGVTKVGGSYRLGVITPKDDKNASVFDCAEFTSWLIYQLTGKLFGCANNNGNPASADAYTGFWKRDADIIGRKITIEEAATTKGAFLLRYSGSGMIGHIVVSDGAGGTVEAHSTKKGVIRSTIKNRRWDIGVAPVFVSYDVPKYASVPIEPPNGIIYRFTTPLMKGDVIKKIQKAVGMADGQIDGIFGSKTFYAVREFQNKKGLTPDGEVGPITMRALKIK